jgi:hypothetical protein
MRSHGVEVLMHALLLAVTLAMQPAPKHIDVDEDEVVEGTNKNPDGEAIFAHKKTRFGTLIKLREDFRRELLKSAEDR